MKQIRDLNNIFRNRHQPQYSYDIYLTFYQSNAPWSELPWNNGNSFLIARLESDILDKHYEYIINRTIFLLK